jgi:hypothetical protein
MARLISLFWVVIAVSGCSSWKSRAPEKHVYVPVEGEVTILRERRKALAPQRAPEVVHRAVHAGNQLQWKPYRYGGGHAHVGDSGYDCSGMVSYVLIKSGLLRSPMPSEGFRNYGEPGQGRWITVWATHDHVFLTIGGLRLDTGWVREGDERGPRWKTRTRPTPDYVCRHPRGL